MNTIFEHDDTPIFACARRDELARRWREEGDERALEILLAASAPDLRSGPLRGERDREIRAVAAWLEAALPGVNKTSLAKLLAKAGRAVGRGDSLRPTVFPGLDDGERLELAARLEKILAWSPSTTRNAVWPSKRQIDAILK